MTSGRIMLRGHLSPVDFLQGFFKTLLRRNFTVASVRYNKNYGKKDNKMVAWLMHILKHAEPPKPNHHKTESNVKVKNSSSSESVTSSSSRRDISHSSNPEKSSTKNSKERSSNTKNLMDLNKSSSTPRKSENTKNVKNKDNKTHVKTIKPNITMTLSSPPSNPSYETKSNASNLIQNPKIVKLGTLDEQKIDQSIYSMRNNDLLSIKKEEIEQIYEQKNYAYLRAEDMKNFRLITRSRSDTIESNILTENPPKSELKDKQDKQDNPDMSNKPDKSDKPDKQDKQDKKDKT